MRAERPNLVEGHAASDLAHLLREQAPHSRIRNPHINPAQFLAHAHTHARARMPTHTCTRKHTQAHTHAHARAHAHTRTLMHKQTQMRTHARAHARARTHTRKPRIRTSAFHTYASRSRLQDCVAGVTSACLTKAQCRRAFIILSSFRARWCRSTPPCALDP